MCNNIIVTILKRNCDAKHLNFKQISQPPKSQPANS